MLSLMILIIIIHGTVPPPALSSFPTRRSSDLVEVEQLAGDPPDLRRSIGHGRAAGLAAVQDAQDLDDRSAQVRSEEHTSELQSPDHLVCRLLLEKKNNI